MTGDFQSDFETRLIGRYSGAAGTSTLLLHRQDDGRHLDPVMWG